MHIGTLFNADPVNLNFMEIVFLVRSPKGDTTPWSDNVSQSIIFWLTINVTQSENIIDLNSNRNLIKWKFELKNKIEKIK